MANFKISVLHGTRRKGNFSGRVAKYVFEKLQSISDIDSELLDLTTYNFPILEERMNVMTHFPPGLQEFTDKLAVADGIIIVSPEYKNGIPGGLKNALDYLPPGAFRRKVVGIITVSSGGFGGLNCLAQLRLVCISMGGVVIPERFPVSHVQEAFEEEDMPLNVKDMDEVFLRFWNDFIWHTEAIVGRKRRS